MWSSFAQQAPVWRDEDRSDPTALTPIVEPEPFEDRAPSAALDAPDPTYEPLFEELIDSPGRTREPVERGGRAPLADPEFADPDFAETDFVDPEVVEPEPSAAEPRPKVREPIRIGADPTGGVERGRPGGTRPSDRGRPGAARPGQRPPTGGTGGRDMPTAVALGFVLALAFVLAVKFFGSTGVMGVVVVILALASIEFYEKVQERGYRPALITGVLACVLMPLGAYWQGERAIVLGLFLATVATVVTMMGFSGIESGPLPNTAITLTGVVWIGVMGSFAGLILRAPYSETIGTDTIFALVVAVVANDIGALLVGSAGGRTPLRPWISPNKTIEGLIGGTVVTIGAMILLKIVNSEASTWVSMSHYLLLAVVVSILAPIGDLTESMFKRNLEIKDFGTLIPGHGGVLDRFDGFLLTLPAAYYLLVVLEPWTKFVPGT
ncbi:MAG: phosphatidate cytidylyltransferase [Ilumatobacteraceae bacterium]